MSAQPDIWQLLEDAPKGAEAVADLYHWSTNYDAGDGPFTLFLDMLGYSDEEFGQPIYGPTVRLMGEYSRTGSWDDRLGYVELSKLGAALIEYANSPQDVRAFVDRLMLAEAGDNDSAGVES